MKININDAFNYYIELCYSIYEAHSAEYIINGKTMNFNKINYFIKNYLSNLELKYNIIDNEELESIIYVYIKCNSFITYIGVEKDIQLSLEILLKCDI